MTKRLPDPSRKLRKTTYENFAQARSEGKILSHAWAEATGVVATAQNDGALRVSGKRVADRPEVAARIACLVEERARRKEDAVSEITVPDVIDRATIIEIALETTRALESAHAALLDSAAPEIRIRQFYQILSSHLSRQQRLISEGAEVPEDDSPRNEIIRRFNKIYQHDRPTAENYGIQHPPHSGDVA